MGQDTYQLEVRNLPKCNSKSFSRNQTISTLTDADMDAKYAKSDEMLFRNQSCRPAFDVAGRICYDCFDCFTFLNAQMHYETKHIIFLSDTTDNCNKN